MGDGEPDTGRSDPTGRMRASASDLFVPLAFTVLVPCVVAVAVTRQWWVAVSVGVLALVLAARQAAASVMWDDREVVAHNTFRTVRLSWSDVVGVGYTKRFVNFFEGANPTTYHLLALRVRSRQRLVPLAGAPLRQRSAQSAGWWPSAMRLRLTGSRSTFETAAWRG